MSDPRDYDVRMHEAARIGRIGSDRMALGLPCIPNDERGDMDAVATLRAENARLGERIDRLRALADAGDRIISRFSLNGTMLAILGTSGYPKYKAAVDTHHDLDAPAGQTTGGA